MPVRAIIKSLKCWASLRATIQSFRSRSGRKCAPDGRSGARQTDYQSLMSHSSNIPRATQLPGAFTEMKMTEATVTKVVGAVYCAFATMLSEEGLALMNDTLRFAAVTGSEEEKRILSLIADATERSRAVQ